VLACADDLVRGFAGASLPARRGRAQGRWQESAECARPGAADVRGRRGSSFAQYLNTVERDMRRLPLKVPSPM
jgi:hypothetical protein